MLGDLFKAVGQIIGTVAGPIIGISYDIIATTLGISVAMVAEAVKAGCESYEDIKDYHKI
ncbi:MAG: hypothetical protein ACJAVA_000227 [Flavobacteriaceae bacterium]|jgi:hypothetical protein